MSLAKLSNLGLSAWSVSRLAGEIQQHRQQPKGSDVLLKTPFIQWCKELRIKSDRGLIPFELFQWQEDFSQVILDNPRIPITLLSSRQTGKTALVLAILVWLAMSREQFTAVVIHRKGEDVRQLARRLKKFIPSDCKLESDGLSLIEFAATGSQLHFRSCNPRDENGAEGVGRGLASVDLAVIEEASHTSNVADVMAVLGPCLTWSAMATVLQIGTAGKRESYYYEGLTQAFGDKEALEEKLEAIRTGEAKPYQVKRSPTRIAVVTNWRAIQRFASEGKDNTGRPKYLARIAIEQDLSPAQIDSEHELIFDSDTTLAVFDFRLVMAAQRGAFMPADKTAIYYAGVDGSGKPKPSNKKGDYTVLAIIEKTSSEAFRLVSLYRKRGITFERRYAEISEMLTDYGPIQTYVEANDGMGQSYCEAISTACSELTIERFTTTKERKNTAINKLDLAIERGHLAIPKCPAITELLGFQQLEDGSMGAVGKDAHDDTVMAMALALSAARYGVITNG